MEEHRVHATKYTLAASPFGESTSHGHDLEQVGHDGGFDAGRDELTQEEGGEVRSLPRHSLEGLEEAVEPLLGVHRLIGDRSQAGRHIGEGRLESGDIQAPLAPEVIADQGLVDPRPLGEILDGDPVEAPPGEEMRPGLEERPAGGERIPLLAALPTGSGERTADAEGADHLGQVQPAASDGAVAALGEQLSIRFRELASAMQAGDRHSVGRELVLCPMYNFTY